MSGRAQHRFWRRFRRDRTAVVAGAFLIGLGLVAIFAPLIAPYDPLDQDLSNTLLGPGGTHLLGTDHLGRDVLSRLIVASRISLRASGQAVLVAVLIGVPLGLAAGYLGGRWDRLIMRVTDIVMALPGVVLVVALVAVFGNNLTNAMIALGLVFSPTLLRLARGATLAVREEQYIDAARVLGLSTYRLVRRHILPNVASPILVQTALTLGVALLVEAGLSFIGLGVQPPNASWGKMLAEASTYASRQPFILFPPGLIITLTVLAINFLGDGLRDSLGRGVSKPRRPQRVRGTARHDVPPNVSAPVAAAHGALLSLRDVSISFPDEQGRLVPVADGVNLDVAPGELVGLIGESGSGKTMTALSVLGLVPRPGVVSGHVLFGGRDLVGLSERALRDVRGREIAMIFQEPGASLDPVFTVGHQIAEPLRRHLGLDRAAARRRAVELLDRVGVPNPNRRVDDYPHQFSGGMAQRAMIAMALSCDPKLLIADEPTTALDVTTQAEVLDLLRELQAEFRMAVLLITHDLGVLADLCDRAMVMYAGQVVEVGDVAALFRTPTHPYTEALLQVAPEGKVLDDALLPVIPGSVPQPGAWPTGCRFHPRCRYVTDACLDDAPSLRPVGSVSVRCVRADDLSLTATRSVS